MNKGCCYLVCPESSIEFYHASIVGAKSLQRVLFLTPHSFPFEFNQTTHCGGANLLLFVFIETVFLGF